MAADLRVSPAPGSTGVYTHPAAGRVAAHVHAVLAGLSRAVQSAVVPDVAVIATAIDVAFWGSLRREEGASPQVTLAFVTAEAAEEQLVFRRPLRLGAAALARLAPAVEHPGVHLGVSCMTERGGAVGVWGMTRRLRPFTLVLEVVAPGLLVLKYPPGDGGKFVNLVVIEGDEVRIVDHGAVASIDLPNGDDECVRTLSGPTPLIRQFGLDDPEQPWAPVAETLLEIAVAMRLHGRGGMLLVVPGETDGWHGSLVRSNPYRVLRDDAVAPPSTELTPEAIAIIAGLTAVDGATVLSETCEVLAFGAKVVRRRGRPQVRRVLVSQPIVGDVPRVAVLSDIGGTRHLAAAQFVADQPEALALVASQDGRFTVFRWLDDGQVVGARRVDLLLI